MIQIYEAPKVKRLIREFYEEAWKSTGQTRKVFEQIGLELTQFAFDNVFPLKEQPIETLKSVYGAAIARAGFGLFRPSVLKLLKQTFHAYQLPFQTFGLGLARSSQPDKSPAEVYWNTLRSLDTDLDLSSSLVIIYDMGEATGSTIEGVIKELELFKINIDNLYIILGAACIEQTRKRVESFASGIHLIIGSRWRYDERPGPTQFYLNQMYNKKWIGMAPRDWGRCVSGMTDTSSVKAFINWVRESIKISISDREKLYKLWLTKIEEKEIAS
jgi:hypothetical protein